MREVDDFRVTDILDLRTPSFPEGGGGGGVRNSEVLLYMNLSQDRSCELFMQWILRYLVGGFCVRITLDAARKEKKNIKEGVVVLRSRHIYGFNTFFRPHQREVSIEVVDCSYG